MISSINGYGNGPEGDIREATPVDKAEILYHQGRRLLGILRRAEEEGWDAAANLSVQRGERAYQKALQNQGSGQSL